MPKKLKSNEPSIVDEFEYQGTVRQDLLNIARTGELLNDHHNPSADHYTDFEEKDLQATINHLERDGWYGDAKHLRNRLKIITQG